MSFMSKDEFLKQQAARTAARESRDSNKPFVGYFKIGEDGGEAVVRFAYSDPSQFGIYTVHDGNSDTKWKRVNCMNDFTKGVTNCPLCAAGQPVRQRFYINLIEYTRNDDGSISANARVWDRPTSYINILTNLFTEYGDISKCVFKVKRSGKGLDTTYAIMYGNPTIYNDQLYPADFSAFDGYDILGEHGQILNKSYEELAAMAGGAPEAMPATHQTYTPPTFSAGTTAGPDPNAVVMTTTGAPNTNTVSYTPQDAFANAQAPRRTVTY